MGEDTGSVSYTVKELLAKLDGKVDTILLALSSKAEKSEVLDLNQRLVALESQVKVQERINHALRDKSASDFSRREKIIGVFVALLAVAVQLYIQFGG